MSGRWKQYELGRGKRGADKRRLAAVERDLQAFSLIRSGGTGRQEREAVGELRRQGYFYETIEEMTGIPVKALKRCRIFAEKAKERKEKK